MIGMNWLKDEGSARVELSVGTFVGKESLEESELESVLSRSDKRKWANAFWRKASQSGSYQSQNESLIGHVIEPPVIEREVEALECGGAACKVALRIGMYLHAAKAA